MSVYGGQAGWLERLRGACSVGASNFRAFEGTVAAGENILSHASESHIAILLTPDRNELTRQYVVSNAKVVMIDGAGATINLENVTRAFNVSGGAQLCLVNMIVDGQNNSAFYADGVGTKLLLRNVTVRNCKTSETGTGIENEIARAGGVRTHARLPVADHPCAGRRAGPAHRSRFTRQQDRAGGSLVRRVIPTRCP